MRTSAERQAVSPFSHADHPLAGTDCIQDGLRVSSKQEQSWVAQLSASLKCTAEWWRNDDFLFRLSRPTAYSATRTELRGPDVAPQGPVDRPGSNRCPVSRVVGRTSKGKPVREGCREIGSGLVLISNEYEEAAHCTDLPASALGSKRVVSTFLIANLSDREFLRAADGD